MKDVKMELVDVPLPEPRQSIVAKYPLDELEVGGPALLIIGRQASQIAPVAAKAKKRIPGRNYVVRNVPMDEMPEGATMACRVWRTA